MKRPSASASPLALPRTDVPDFHIDFLHDRWHYFAHRAVTRLHGRLDLPDILSFYGMFRKMPLVAISNGQRNYLPQNWVGTVHQGLPRDLLPFEPKAKILCRHCPGKAGVAPAPSI